MQTPDFGEDPSPAEDVLAENGHDNTSFDSTEPYVPPRIPLGLPHVVHFVEASLWHLPQTIRTVGERMSRYADKDGKASIALPFLCEIAGLGSKNTAEHAIAVMASMGVLGKAPGQGRKGPQIQHVHVPGQGAQLAPPAGRETRDKPLDRAVQIPARERSAAGGERGTEVPNDPPDQRSLCSDRWRTVNGARQLRIQERTWDR